MSTPPRRRRNPAASDSGGGGGWLPTIAIGMGVVIAGLGIGALVAVLMQRNSTKLQPVAAVTSTPGRPIPPTRIPAPVAIATLEPPHTPQPSPSAAETPTTAPTENPSAEPSPSATIAPTPKPSHAPTPKPAVKASLAPSRSAGSGEVASASAAARPVHAATAVPSPAGTETPRPEASAVAAAPSPSPSTASAVAPAALATQSGYDERASAVVRRYIGALIRGDEKTAHAALGGSDGMLSERDFIDPGARIVGLKVTRIDASNASVGCEIATAKGHYYGTYHIKAATGGPYIAEHDYIKV